MTELLDDIQTDLADMAADLEKGDLEGARYLLHYLHAYIETRKQGLVAAETAEPELAGMLAA